MRKQRYQVIFYKTIVLFLLSFSTGHTITPPKSSASLVQILQNASLEKNTATETTLTNTDTTTIEKPILQNTAIDKIDVSVEKTNKKNEEFEWTFMFYVQAKNNLFTAIMENFHEIAKTLKSDKVAIYVQWYLPNHEGIQRFHITPNSIERVYSSDSFHDNHLSQELIDFVEWCMERAPAKKYAAILSNHGLGIIDPEWGKPVKMIQNPLSMLHNQRVQIEDLVDTLHFDTFSDNNRGILFDETRRVYMNNQELVKSFEGIKKLRKGEKLDLIGMDACYMQMLGIADILSPYGKNFVASQDVELARGWGYAGIMKSLNQNPKCSGKELAQYIVNSYDGLYKGKTNLFTLSALDLESVQLVKNRTGDLSNLLLKLYEKNNNETKSMVRQARSRCQQFSMQAYVDLKSFCQELQKLIPATKKELKPLSTMVNSTIAAIDKSVISNTASTYFNRAHGLSIYFPLYRIDKSFIDTPFARNSSWLELLYKSLLM